ncbi:MAG: 50S ribosomal protein L1 [Deltaproteobacteria bacterium]|nr:50S ribosomal protein L1 [Deltaproteobacteria bacterium]
MSGKKYKQAFSKVDRARRFSVDEALGLLSTLPVAKFDETVDVSVRLGVDPKQTDQMVRGSVPLPHGSGRQVRIVVIAKGDKQEQAQKAGATVVGGEELIEKIEKGWMDFDKVVTTPDMMKSVSRVAKILGPRGLMPNPKMGTVTFDVGTVVQELKAGRAEYRIEKAGIVHCSIGKLSFGKEKLKENLIALMDSIVRAKPKTSKGTYLRSVTVSSTMGPGVKLDPASLQTT